MKVVTRNKVFLKSFKKEVFGIDLIPETDEDQEITERFWNGGVFVMGYGTDKVLTLTFEDLIEKGD